MLTGLALAGLAPWLLGCGGNSVGSVGGPSDGEGLKVVATTSVLADIAQRVAGDLFRVEALISPGTDPHAFEPTPSDLKRIVGADLVIVNGAGLEGDLEDYLDDVDENSIVVASEGLTSRTPAPGEPGHAADGEEHAEEAEEHADEQAHEGEADPHFWLDPVLVQTYVQNIAAAFEKADPDHAAEYAAGAEAFDQELIELDVWTSEQVAALPAERRKLVMNHASHGYWADRYGFDVVGAVIPSVSTGSAPTAKDLAELLETIEREGVPAIFVQTGENPRLASQIAADTGIVVVDDLFTGSLSETDGVAPSYLEMMRYNTGRIVEALKP
jgi:ABC-type Zn uptake system ZnuABC Zn-binding protein ZnuA